MLQGRESRANLFRGRGSRPTSSGEGESHANLFRGRGSQAPLFRGRSRESHANRFRGRESHATLFRGSSRESHANLFRGRGSRANLFCITPHSYTSPPVMFACVPEEKGPDDKNVTIGCTPVTVTPCQDSDMHAHSCHCHSPPSLNLSTR